MRSQINLLLGLFGVAVAYGAAATIDMNQVQQKNINQIQAISESFGSLSSNNVEKFSKINIESVQARNKIQISNLKITKSNMPNIDPAKLVPNEINVVDLIKKAQVEFNKDPANAEIALFISFTSMESTTVNQYVAQATRYKIPIVLRGFIKNSYKETALYIRDMRVAYPELTILIDPPAYEKFNVTEVPTLVVSKSSTSPLKDGCAAAGDYSKVAGEVSIQSMLDYVRLNSKNPMLASAAAERLNYVRQKSYYKIN